MSDFKMKFIALLSLEKNEVLVCTSAIPYEEKFFKKIAAEQILTPFRQGKLVLPPNNVNYLVLQFGTWYLYKDDKNLLYCTCVDASNDRGTVYQILNQLKDHIQILGKTYHQMKTKIISDHMKQKMDELSKQYNGYSVNVVSSAQAKGDQIKVGQKNQENKTKLIITEEEEKQDKSKMEEEPTLGNQLLMKQMNQSEQSQLKELISQVMDAEIRLFNALNRMNHVEDSKELLILQTKAQGFVKSFEGYFIYEKHKSDLQEILRQKYNKQWGKLIPDQNTEQYINLFKYHAGIEKKEPCMKYPKQNFKLTSKDGNQGILELLKDTKIENKRKEYFEENPNSNPKKFSIVSRDKPQKYY